MNHQTMTQSTVTVGERGISERIVSAAVLFVLGVSLLYFTGFSHLQAAHNAAHDARHSAAFPCH